MCSPPIISCLQQKGQLPSNKPVLLAIVYNVFIVGLSSRVRIYPIARTEAGGARRDNSRQTCGGAARTCDYMWCGMLDD